MLLAAGLGARQCELVKDVPGYFSADPNVDPSAAHLLNVEFSDALGARLAFLLGSGFRSADQAGEGVVL